jgi:hypothetical protein
VAGIEKEFQNIQTPKDRRSQTCHSNTLSRPSEFPGHNPSYIVGSKFRTMYAGVPAAVQ